LNADVLPKSAETFVPVCIINRFLWAVKAGCLLALLKAALTPLQRHCTRIPPADEAHADDGRKRSVVAAPWQSYGNAGTLPLQVSAFRIDSNLPTIIDIK